MVLSLWLIFFGRLVLGFGCGLLLVATSIYVKETLPPKTVEPCLTSLNLGIAYGIVIITSIQVACFKGMDTLEMSTTKNWRIVFLSPMVVALLNMTLWLVCLKYDSLTELVKSGKLTQAEQQLKRIYRFKNDSEI